MQNFLNKILKFFFGFGLAVLVSGFVYNYFPQDLFTASLANSQKQKIKEEQIIFTKEPDVAIPMDQYMGTHQDATEEKDNVLSYQDKLDDIAEQIDIIRREINDLIEENNKLQTANYKQENEDEKIEEDKEESKEESETETSEKNTIVAVVSSGTKIIYPKILISEAQIAPIEQRFVELYNPNDAEVDLTDWYLQRKTQNADSWGSLVSSTKFANFKIPAHGFFLISREIAGSNILEDITLSENNSLALKDPNRDISDLLGWGQAGDFEGNLAESPPDGLSVGRKWENNSERDFDNNFTDFEIQNPTPKAQNLKYIAPTVVPEVPQEPLKNILISEIQIEGQTAKDEFVELYNPNNVDVNLTGFSLKKKISNGSESNLVSGANFVGSIPALGYFLIAPRNNEDGTPNYTGAIPPDLNFSGKDYSITPDNTILFYNNEQTPILLDKVGFGMATDFEVLTTVTPEDGKALARIWLDSENTEQDTDNNFNDFQIKTPTPKSKNREPSIEPSVEPMEPKDIAPPSVNFNLSAVQTTLSFSINFEITDILETASSGVVNYIFRWTDLDPAVEEGWQQDNAVGISRDRVLTDASMEKFSGTKSFEGQDGKTYYFQIKAKDGAENWSGFLPAEPAFTTIDLLETTSPPYIEIYTVDGMTIDLKFSQEVKANVDILDSAGQVILKDFYKSDKVTNPRPKTWDGKDGNGILVPAGIYTIKVGISNSNGSVIDTSKTINVATMGISP